MATIGGVGEDPLTARFGADRADVHGHPVPAARWPGPNVLATAISAAITERPDAIVEFVLDTRTDGGPVVKHAEAIFAHARWPG